MYSEIIRVPQLATAILFHDVIWHKAYYVLEYFSLKADGKLPSTCLTLGIQSISFK